MTTEQRDSYRCPIADESQKAVIRVGKRDVVVALTDQSASGFSVTAKGNLGARVGKVLTVRTSAGWLEARVIHKQKQAGQTTLGLVRLADLPDPRDAQLVKPGGSKFQAAGSGSTNSSSLLLVTIVAGLAFWGFLVNFAWFRGPDAAGKPVDLGVYFSRMVDTVTSTAQDAPSRGTDAAASNATID
jgi:hypothetical protein